MLLRVAVFSISIIVAAFYLPSVIDVSFAPAQSNAVAEEASPVAAAATLPPHGTFTIKSGADSHFWGDFRINGRAVHGVVDTGATFVALNESEARRLGISSSRLDFKYATQTANGLAEAARINLDRMEIGTVRVRDVEAVVLRDKSLSFTLVGMSFLKKLESYKVEDGALQMKR